LDLKYFSEKIGEIKVSKMMVKMTINKKFTAIAKPQWSAGSNPANHTHKIKAPKMRRPAIRFFTTTI
jgi:hypothetical protein